MSLVVGCLLLVVGCWLLVVGCLCGRGRFATLTPNPCGLVPCRCVWVWRDWRPITTRSCPRAQAQGNVDRCLVRYSHHGLFERSSRSDVASIEPISGAN